MAFLLLEFWLWSLHCGLAGYCCRTPLFPRAQRPICKYVPTQEVFCCTLWTVREHRQFSGERKKQAGAAAEGGACSTVVAHAGTRQNEWADSRASHTVISPQAAGSTSWVRPSTWLCAPFACFCDEIWGMLEQPRDHCACWRTGKQCTHSDRCTGQAQ